MNFLLIDTANLFFRIRHTAHRGASLDDKLGMSMHMMIMAANKLTKTNDIDHVVFALEGRRSWRKDFYSPYKKPRADDRQARTEEQIEEDDLFWEVYNDFTKYLQEHTKCSVIQAEHAEGDDVIARFIQLHPGDNHIILSSDTDFVQLLAENVQQFNGITKQWITTDGYFNEDMKPVIDNKTKEHKVLGDPKYVLFKKCIRGDKSDNVFSAYPGVREKGSKNKVGLLEAFEDRERQGYNWNNLMLQRWMDHNDKEHRVKDDYERNVHLIDLTAQPAEIIEGVDDAIENTIARDELTMEANSQVTFQFMKFCNRHDLQRLSDYPQQVIAWITKPYPGGVDNIKAHRQWQKLKQK